MTAPATPAPAASGPDAATPSPASAKRDTPPVLTGSGQVLASLEKLGVTDVFGIPGGQRGFELFIFVGGLFGSP